MSDGAKDAALHAARQVKHAGLVAGKRASGLASAGKWRALDVIAPQIARVSSYRYRPSRYRRSFLTRPAPETQPAESIPRRVFALWTGDNDLTPNRARNLERMRDVIGVPVVLVTPETLSSWVLDEHPLHAAYEHLSLVHRSDYLRAYLMHHHGGGYCDIKRPLADWSRAFDVINADRDVWLVGCREQRAKDPARLPGALGRDVTMNYTRLATSCSYIVRAGTQFTAEWLREVERRMDYFSPQLAEFPGGVRGEVVGYPVSWNDLLGKVFHPLQLKHLERVRLDASLYLDYADYQ